MARPIWVSCMRGLGWAWMLMMALALANTAWAADDAPGRVARIAEVKGTTWVQEGEDGEWFEAERNRPLTGGTRLQVAANGHL